MKMFNNLKIATKLLTGFIIIAIISGIVGTVAIYNINEINNNDTELYENHTATLPDLANVARTYQRMRVSLRDLYIVTDPSEVQNIINEFDEFDKIVSENMARFEAGIVDSNVRSSFDALSKSLDDFYVYRDKVVSFALSNQIDEVYNQLTSDEAIRIADEVQKNTDDMMNLKTELAEQASEKNSAAARTSTITMLIIITAAVMLAIVLGIFISRIISRPINKMVKAADKLALGDIDINIDIDSKDEIGNLANSFKDMIENIQKQALAAERIAEGDMTIEVDIRSEKDLLGKKLSEIVEKNNEILTNISNASEQVASGSKQVSDSSIALSQGATEQASSIEELTASLEEISSQTKLNAQNADNANELAESAKLNAERGNNQMKEMLRAIEDINDASGSISKIIKVIDDIAFQTNILALNAAVEAARAGQHGKGFAVVAEEVRNLAARSADAAKETTDMIEDSIKKSEDGTKIARNAASALNEILDGAEKVATLVNNISVASNEQASGIEQINQGIMQVSQVVQANSATSEESAAASEELSSQAGLLKEMVSKFKLKKNVKSYDSLDQLNPEVLRMIEKMSEKNNTNSSSEEEVETTEPKIALSDKEFGKY